MVWCVGDEDSRKVVFSLHVYHVSNPRFCHSPVYVLFQSRKTSITRFYIRGDITTAYNQRIEIHKHLFILLHT